MQRLMARPRQNYVSIVSNEGGFPATRMEKGRLDFTPWSLKASGSRAGLPEEARLVRTARKFSYVPVAFSSADKESRCWDAQWLDKSRDIAAVRAGCSFSCMPATVCSL